LTAALLAVGLLAGGLRLVPAQALGSGHLVLAAHTRDAPHPKAVPPRTRTEDHESVSAPAADAAPGATTPAILQTATPASDANSCHSYATYLPGLRGPPRV